MRTPRPIALALVSLALFAGAAACSSDDGSEGTEKKTTTTAAPEAEATTTTEGDDVDPDDGDETTTTVSEEDLGDADRDAYVAALAGSFGEDTEGIFEEGQIDCLSEGFVDVLGVDDLKEAGLSPEGLAETNGDDFPAELGVDEEKANAMFDVYEDCDVDFSAVFKEIFGGLKDTGLTAAEESCIDELLTSDNLRRSLVADILGEDLEEDPLDEVEGCVDLGEALGGGSGPVAEAPSASPSTVVPD